MLPSKPSNDSVGREQEPASDGRPALRADSRQKLSIGTHLGRVLRGVSLDGAFRWRVGLEVDHV
jgi:hypothetical protein